MPVTDLYSKRLKRSLGDVPDVYVYESIPNELRTQIVHIWSDLTSIAPHGRTYEPKSDVQRMFSRVAKALAREYGRLQLVDDHLYFQYHLHCYSFLLTCRVENALDIIELSFQDLLEHSRATHWKARIEDAISELNHRFREHGVGYQFEDGFIVRVDSQFVHNEVVRPALALLHASGFEGASEEFLTAHEHYRHGRNKEAISEALKAYESTLKTICEQKNWEYPDTANASKLVEIVIRNDLVPRYLLDHMSGLRSALDSGLVTLRNRGSAHGQGAQSIAAPDSVAAFALHLAAANILFLVERYKELT